MREAHLSRESRCILHGKGTIMGQLDINLARSMADERRADAMRLAEHRLRMADRLEGEALPQRSRVESLLERLHATRLAVRLHLIRATTEPAQIVVR